MAFNKTLNDGAWERKRENDLSYLDDFGTKDIDGMRIVRSKYVETLQTRLATVPGFQIGYGPGSQTTYKAIERSTIQYWIEEKLKQAQNQKGIGY